MQQTNENDPNKNQPPANQPGMAANQNVQNRTNGQQPPSKSPMEIEVPIVKSNSQFYLNGLEMLLDLWVWVVVRALAQHTSCFFDNPRKRI